MNRNVRPAYAGTFVNDQMHLGIGVGDLGLIQPTGDPVMSVITNVNGARPGVFVPQGLGLTATGQWARSQRDGNYYNRTINPREPAQTLAGQELVYTDLAGNGGMLMGEIGLQGLLDIAALNAQGSGAVGG